MNREVVTPADAVPSPLGAEASALLAQFPDGVALLDACPAGLVIVTCNPPYAAAHGTTVDALAGRPLSSLLATPDDVLPHEPPTSREVIRVGDDGRVFTAEVSLSWMTFASGRYLLETLRDVTSRRSRESALLQLAREDVLTGLGNRRAFEEDIESELARAARHHYPVTVLTADLDGLKQVNDSQGHDQGDALLRAFARALKSRLRRGDRVYRLGGDEFAAILAHTGPGAFGSVLRKMREAIEQTRLDVGIGAANASVGYATYPDEALTQGDLIRLADERMYSQKRAHHAALSSDTRAAGRSDATVQALVRRAVRSTFALLSSDASPDEFGWGALLEAATASVPGAERGSLFLLENGRYVARAFHGYPEEMVGAVQSLEHALGWYGGSEDEWRQGRPRVLKAANAARKQEGSKLDFSPCAHPTLAEQEFDKLAPFGATLCVPIVVEGKVVAHLNFETREQHDEFHPAAEQHAREFAGHVAALMASWARKAREADRKRELEALAALNVALGTARTEEAVEWVLVEQAIALLVTRYATFLRYDETTDCLRSTAGLGSFAPSSPVVLPRGKGLSWIAVDERRVARFADARLDTRGYVHESVEVPLATLYAPVVTSGGQVLGVLAVGREASPFTDLDTRLAHAMVSAAATSLERIREADVVRETREGALLALGLALEARDFETHGHTRRVVSLALALGEAVSLDQDALEALREGAYLHDIGKLSIPDAILLKPGRLEPEERLAMQEHARLGDEVTAKIPSLHPAAREVVRAHHEWWDGSGYPDGLAGEAIPFLARLFALVDVYDALTTERPYKRAWSAAEARAELERMAGRQFDPALVPVFLRVLDEHEGPADA